MKTILTFLIILTSFSHAFADDKAIDVAIANPKRPAEEKTADERRHPKELLQFSKVKSGDVVMDLIAGKGYFTRLFISLVGPNGKVIAYTPKELENSPYKIVEAAKKAVEGAKNAEARVTPLAVAPAEKLDVIWTSQNYHDLHIKSFIDADMTAYNKLLFKMLKPGGYFIVVDHVSEVGADIEKLHRIDPKIVRKEIEAAGFVLDEESKVLANPKDDHKLNVFDPAIRGKTDQFAYRFLKPKK